MGNKFGLLDNEEFLKLERELNKGCSSRKFKDFDRISERKIEIISAIKDKPDIIIQDIIDKTNIKRSTLNYYLKLMEKEKIIRSRRELDGARGRPRIITLTTIYTKTKKPKYATALGYGIWAFGKLLRRKKSNLRLQ